MVPSFQVAGQHTLKLIRRFKSSASISHFISSSFLPGLLLVKAVSKLDKSTKSVLEEADKLYSDRKYVDLQSLLQSHCSSNDPEILWRLSRAIFENCRDIKDDKEKLQNLEEALRFIDNALEINEECWPAHKWRAILLDYVWRYKSTKGRIIHSFDRAIELNPTDSTSYYLLGEWCFTFAEMPWYQRKVASAIFASPPTSTYEGLEFSMIEHWSLIFCLHILVVDLEPMMCGVLDLIPLDCHSALQYFEKAEEVSPSFYSMNLLMIGKCFLNMNKKEKGIKFLKLTKDYPIKTFDDQKAHDEAEKLLKNLNA
ncbi:regulator of microtubule dynamics protein 1 [Caerostris extrusa]|uniref:Regulator of microtubule dynamics protein 1 n=1 Tax=Caerostris extrusa TaxID=172846 RepID=A0AAV4NJD3_CAEEX|nr:regulator of microtubule dynamics protein 1 [Caerostris extrusa]